MAVNHQRTPQLKPLLDTVPPGFMVDTPWLRGRGIDPKSIHGYVARGWLERVVRGVYRRPLPKGAESGAEEPWVIPLLSLQRLMKCPVHLGGESALDMFGHVHHLSLGGKPRVHFHGEVPSWLKRLPIRTEIVTRRRTLFGDVTLGIDDAHPRVEETRPMVDVWRWPIRTSTPERAILEALEELPRNTTFGNIDLVFEGLVSLRPGQLSELLKACRSVKVKRLFLVFADRHQHAWRKHLDTSGIDFGSGPRALVEGGRIHPTYRIYVPEALLTGTRQSADDHA